jgi:hypothetical protein
MSAPAGEALGSRSVPLTVRTCGRVRGWLSEPRSGCPTAQHSGSRDASSDASGQHGIRVAEAAIAGRHSATTLGLTRMARRSTPTGRLSVRTARHMAAHPGKQDSYQLRMLGNGLFLAILKAGLARSAKEFTLGAEDSPGRRFSRCSSHVRMMPTTIQGGQSAARLDTGPTSDRTRQRWGRKRIPDGLARLAEAKIERW